MTADQEIRKIALGVGVLLALAGVALLLWLPDSLPAARALKPQVDHWALDQPARVESDAAISAINQAGLWGGNLPGATAAAAAETPLTPPDWRITGVYMGTAKPVLLLSFEGQPIPQYLHVGDKLPGGGKILSISTQRICLLSNGRRLSLSTYPK